MAVRIPVFGGSRVKLTSSLNAPRFSTSASAAAFGARAAEARAANARQLVQAGGQVRQFGSELQQIQDQITRQKAIDADKEMRGKAEAAYQDYNNKLTKMQSNFHEFWEDGVADSDDRAQDAAEKLAASYTEEQSNPYFLNKVGTRMSSFIKSTTDSKNRELDRMASLSVKNDTEGAKLNLQVGADVSFGDPNFINDYIDLSHEYINAKTTEEVYGATQGNYAIRDKSVIEGIQERAFGNYLEIIEPEIKDLARNNPEIAADLVGALTEKGFLSEDSAGVLLSEINIQKNKNIVENLGRQSTLLANSPVLTDTILEGLANNEVDVEEMFNAGDISQATYDNYKRNFSVDTVIGRKEKADKERSKVISDEYLLNLNNILEEGRPIDIENYKRNILDDPTLTAADKNSLLPKIDAFANDTVKFTPDNIYTSMYGDANSGKFTPEELHNKYLGSASKADINKAVTFIRNQGVAGKYPVSSLETKFEAFSGGVKVEENRGAFNDYMDAFYNWASQQDVSAISTEQQNQFAQEYFLTKPVTQALSFRNIPEQLTNAIFRSGEQGLVNLAEVRRVDPQAVREGQLLLNQLRQNALENNWPVEFQTLLNSPDAMQRIVQHGIYAKPEIEDRDMRFITDNESAWIRMVMATRYSAFSGDIFLGQNQLNTAQADRLIQEYRDKGFQRGF